MWSSLLAKRLSPYLCAGVVIEVYTCKYWRQSGLFDSTRVQARGITQAVTPLHVTELHVLLSIMI